MVGDRVTIKWNQRIVAQAAELAIDFRAMGGGYADENTVSYQGQLPVSGGPTSAQLLRSPGYVDAWTEALSKSLQVSKAAIAMKGFDVKETVRTWDGNGPIRIFVHWFVHQF